MSESALRLAPAIPAWLALERESAVQVDREILDCAFFLGIPSQRGFIAEGTGFLLRHVQEELAFFYLISCRHVVKPTASRRDLTPNNELIWVRMNRADGKPPKPIKTKRSEWLFHTDNSIDICVYPCDLAKWDAEGDLSTVSLNTDPVDGALWTPRFEKRWGLHLGDEVFITGAFVGRIGEKKNIPVVRVGTIAALLDEPVWGGSDRRPAYLIETKSLGGISGSPVFLHVMPSDRGPYSHIRHDPNIDARRAPYYLIGMMQGIHSGQYSDDFVSDDDEEKIVPKDADFNAGIGIALPVSLIMEIIERPDLSEARMATIRAKKAKSGYRPASASGRDKVDDASPALGDNPNHLDDFKRLVDVAARKRPQGGQT